MTIKRIGRKYINTLNTCMTKEGISLDFRLKKYMIQEMIF